MLCRVTGKSSIPFHSNGSLNDFSFSRRQYGKKIQPAIPVSWFHDSLTREYKIKNIKNIKLHCLPCNDNKYIYLPAVSYASQNEYDG